MRISIGRLKALIKEAGGLAMDDQEPYKATFIDENWQKHFLRFMTIDELMDQTGATNVRGHQGNADALEADLHSGREVVVYIDPFSNDMSVGQQRTLSWEHSIAAAEQAMSDSIGDI